MGQIMEPTKNPEGYRRSRLWEGPKNALTSETSLKSYDNQPLYHYTCWVFLLRTGRDAVMLLEENLGKQSRVWFSRKHHFW